MDTIEMYKPANEYFVLTSTKANFTKAYKVDKRGKQQMKDTYDTFASEHGEHTVQVTYHIRYADRVYSRVLL